VPLVEDLLLTLPEHYRFSGGFLLLDLSILRGVLYLVDFLISFGQYVVLRITDDDYPIDIFKPF
jgi:hypothetical protein